MQKSTKWSLLLALGLVLSMFLAACSGGDGSSDSGDSDSEETEEASGDQVDKGVGPSPVGTPAAEDKQVYTTYATADMQSLDPHLAEGEFGFLTSGNVMEGLYRLGTDQDGKPTIEPGIAKDHEVNEDGTVWTFNLREDATWSNGDSVTAQDFVYGWQRAVDPSVGSEYGPYMMNGVVKNASAVNNGEVEPSELGVEAVDEYTFKVELEKPVPYFESLVTFNTFFPANQKVVEEYGTDYLLEAGNGVYNGPFTLSEWNQGEGWTMVKNDDYWDADAVSLETINVKIVKENTTAVNLYESGQIDRVSLVGDNVDKYVSNPNLQMALNPTLFYLKFNQTNEALANENIRKGIALAVNNKAITEDLLKNGSIPMEGNVPKEFATDPASGKDFREVNGAFLEQDLEAAQQAFNKGLEELGKDSVTLELLAGDGSTGKDMTEYLQGALSRDLEGLEVEVALVPFKERIRRDNAMEYDVLLSGWGPDYVDPNTFLNMWVTDGENNNMGYSNEQYDQLIEQSATENATEPEKRYENFYEAEKILFEDAALAPLYQEGEAFLLDENVQNLVKSPTGPNYQFKWTYIAESGE